MASATPSAAAPTDDVLIHLALPKGHMQTNVFTMLEDAGVKVRAPPLPRAAAARFAARSPPRPPDR